MDNNLKREIIIENYQDPMNRGLIDDNNYLKVNTNSESCIDNLDFMMKIEDGIIKDIRFDGEACAISTSATSIMIRSLIGKSVVDAKRILINYDNMINEKEYDKELLGELLVYDEMYKQPNRKNCALIPKVAVEKMLGEIENESDY
ncbi:MAG: SUF system NifU family Fe-S cluster assembly protein [Bacilli bacterium]|nr:SUF system NifU family Fe-S cluster assembly protein [Bacilli bacterium]